MPRWCARPDPTRERGGPCCPVVCRLWPKAGRGAPPHTSAGGGRQVLGPDIAVKTLGAVVGKAEILGWPPNIRSPGLRDCDAAQQGAVHGTRGHVHATKVSGESEAPSMGSAAEDGSRGLHGRRSGSAGLPGGVALQATGIIGPGGVPTGFAPSGPQVSSSIGTEAAKRGSGVTLAAPESVSAPGPGAIGRGDRPLPKLHEGGLLHAVPSRGARRGGGGGRGVGRVAQRRTIGRDRLGVRGAGARAGVLPGLQRPRWGSVGRGPHRRVPVGRTTATSHGQPASPGDARHGRRPRIGPGFPAQGGSKADSVELWVHPC